MLIDTNSLKINGNSWVSYLTSAKIMRPKIWSGDTGRNQAGTMKGTLKGVFPKLVLNFRKLTQAELEIVSSVLDSASQTVIYYDTTKKANTTITTYTGDWETVSERLAIKGGKTEPFSVSFITTKARN